MKGKFGEPWMLGRAPEEKRMILNNNRHYVADIQIYQMPRHMGQIYEKVRLANVDRIIACVNALAGIDNPAEYMAAVAKLVNVVEGEVCQLTQWYDSLSNKEDEHAYWIFRMIESLKSALGEIEKARLGE